MGGDEGLNLREGGTGSGDVVEDLLEMRAGERGICVCNLGESTVGVQMLPGSFNARFPQSLNKRFNGRVRCLSLKRFVVDYFE